MSDWPTTRNTTQGELITMHLDAESKPPLMSEEDRTKQVGGDHYRKFRIQPWDIILEHGLDFWEGNAVKYILRRKSDNRVEDLEKARHYLDECIRQAKATRKV